MTTPNTTCLYPQLAPSTAYDKGCRCARCIEGRRIVVDKFKEKNPDYYKIYHKEWYAKNVKQKLASSIQYYKNNAEKIKIYREGNAEKIKTQKKLYRKNNAEKLKVYEAMYYQENTERLRLKRRTPVRVIRAAMNRAKCRMLRMGKHLVPPLNPDEQARLYKFYETRYYLSESTGVMHHVDHIVPGSKGGLHHPDNLQILTASENCKKKDKIL